MSKVNKPAAQNPKAVPESVAPPAGAAKPGTTDAAAKEPKKGKVLYPALVGPKDAEGKDTIIPLKEVPKDWDPKAHKGLRRKDFSDEALFWDWRADRMELQVKKIRAHAEELRKLGTVKDRSRAKKLLSMQKRIADLKAQLEGEGVDVDALLTTLGGDEE